MTYIKYFLYCLIFIVITGCSSKNIKTASTNDYGNLLSTYRYVTAKSGLRMRDDASLKGKKITVIPYTEGVTVIRELNKEETISGEKGKWCEVSWDGKRGWVFGAYLKDDKPFDKKSLTTIEGIYKVVSCQFDREQILFKSSNRCVIVYNMCDGFYDEHCSYDIKDGIITIARFGGDIIINILNKNKLMISSGSYSCGAIIKGSKLVRKY